MAAHETLNHDQEIEGSSDRAFGLVFTAFFSIVGFYPWVRAWISHTGEPRFRVWAVALAGSFFVMALARPRVLNPLNRLWTKFGLLLQNLTNPIIMGAIFYLLITPIALFFRLTKRDPLKRKFEPESQTYWIARDPAAAAQESMKNQF